MANVLTHYELQEEGQVWLNDYFDSDLILMKFLYLDNK